MNNKPINGVYRLHTPVGVKDVSEDVSINFVNIFIKSKQNNKLKSCMAYHMVLP